MVHMGKQRPRDRRIAQGYVIITENNSFTHHVSGTVLSAFHILNPQNRSYHHHASFQMEKLEQREIQTLPGWNS